MTTATKQERTVTFTFENEEFIDVFADSNDFNGETIADGIHWYYIQQPEVRGCKDHSHTFENVQWAMEDTVLSDRNDWYYGEDYKVRGCKTTHDEDYLHTFVNVTLPQGEPLPPMPTHEALAEAIQEVKQVVANF